MHTHNPFLCFSYFSPPYFISICDHKTIPRIPTNTLLLYTSVIFHLLSQHNAFHRKSIPLPQPFSQCRLHQGSNEQGRLMWTDCFNHSLLPRSMSRSNSAHSYYLLITQIHRLVYWMQQPLMKILAIRTIDCSTLPHSLKLISLPPQPTNTIKKPHILLLTSCITTILLQVQLFHAILMHSPLACSEILPSCIRTRN